jgi:hypothetical protein
MEPVAIAARAILLPLDALRVEALVLVGEVIAILAVAAGKNDFFARHEQLRLKRSAGSNPAWGSQWASPRFESRVLLDGLT